MNGRKGSGLGLKAAVAVVVTLGAGFLASPQVSAQSPTISIDSVTVAQGEQRSVDLKALNIAAPGLGAWEVGIVYDPAVVTAVSCSAQHDGFCNVDFATNRVQVVGATATGLQGDTKLAAITFRCESTGSSALAIALDELADATVGGPQGIGVALQNGNVTCTTAAPALSGDANCDGVVNSVDAAIVLQYVAGLIASVSCPANADVDGDGDITSVDAALILQIDAGLI